MRARGKSCVWMKIICFLSLAGVLLGAQSEYAKKRTRARPNGIREPSSPLYVIARHKIQAGTTTIGSAKDSTIILPDYAPALVGTFQRDNAVLTF